MGGKIKFHSFHSLKKNIIFKSNSCLLELSCLLEFVSCVRLYYKIINMYIISHVCLDMCPLPYYICHLLFVMGYALCGMF